MLETNGNNLQRVGILPKYLFRFLKPIFHCKLGSRWVTNANEISTNNMKCTWPMRTFCVGDPTQPLFHWLAFGFALGVTQILCFALGQCSKLRVHPATGVHILEAGCTSFRTYAPGRCMFLSSFQYRFIRKNSWK